MFQLLNILGVKNAEKKNINVSAIAHLQKAPITASRKMCPIPNLLLIGENIIIYSSKAF